MAEERINPFSGNLVIIDLTERETEVLEHMAAGEDMHQIGEMLSISAETVKSHRTSIYLKLAARDKANAVAIGIRRGLIE